MNMRRGTQVLFIIVYLYVCSAIHFVWDLACKAIRIMHDQLHFVDSFIYLNNRHVYLYRFVIPVPHWVTFRCQNYFLKLLEHCMFLKRADADVTSVSPQNFYHALPFFHLVSNFQFSLTFSLHSSHLHKD